MGWDGVGGGESRGGLVGGATFPCYDTHNIIIHCPANKLPVFLIAYNLPSIQCCKMYDECYHSWIFLGCEVTFVFGRHYCNSGKKMHD